MKIRQAAQIHIVVIVAIVAASPSPFTGRAQSPAPRPPTTAEEFDVLFQQVKADTANRLRRWEFMLTINPVPVTGGTGSPLNTLAIF